MNNRPKPLFGDDGGRLLLMAFPWVGVLALLSAPVMYRVYSPGAAFWKTIGIVFLLWISVRAFLTFKGWMRVAVIIPLLVHGSRFYSFATDIADQFFQKDISWYEIYQGWRQLTPTLISIAVMVLAAWLLLLARDRMGADPPPQENDVFPQ